MALNVQAQCRVRAPCTLGTRRPLCGRKAQGTCGPTGQWTARHARTVAWASNDDAAQPWTFERVLGAAVPAIAYATLIFYVGVTSQLPCNNWQLARVITSAPTPSFVVSGAKFAPDQTPLRDQYFIEKLIGLGVDDGVPINPVFFSLFNLMGVYPIIYSSLMIPSARGSVVPVWPFVATSFGLGVFAIFPYLIVWDLQDDAAKSPPDASELTTGWGKYGLQALESQVLPAVCLVATAGLLFNAFSSGVESWNAYFRLFDESKFVHVTSLDFCALSALAPLFLWNDAEKRRAGWALPLAAIPMLGPLIYLILRPRASKP